jgi:hypothetical protein
MSDVTGRAPTATRITTPGGFGGRIRRKMPAPFERPSINVGSNEPRRQWATVMSDQLKAGDIVPSVGRIVSVDEEFYVPGPGSGLTFEGIAEMTSWTVTVRGAGGIIRVYQGGEPVFAFVLPDR